MKKLLFLLLFPVWLGAQTSPAMGNLYEIHTDGTDTLVDYSNDTMIVSSDTLIVTGNDTIIFSFQHDNGNDLDFTRLFEYSITVTVDSVFGDSVGVDGLASLQISNSENDDTTPTWITIDSDALDGTVSQLFMYEGYLRARRLRVLCTAPTGRIVTIVHVDGSAKFIK